MSRPARIRINLTSLRHNLSRVRALAPNSRVVAVVKADAYGHGIERVAQALDDADIFGVACLEEALAIRQAGVMKPVVLLEGPYNLQELQQIASAGIEVVIHDEYQIAMLEQGGLTTPVNTWLKIDTGMHRLGIAPDLFEYCLQRLQQCSAVDKIRLMTHLACANEIGNALTKAQLEIFEALTGALPNEKTVANSAAVLTMPETHLDWVRPGVMLYGVSPFPDQPAAAFDLKPAMTFESRLIAVRQLKKGDRIGYGAAGCCEQDMPVGIVAAGYGDGYPRHAGMTTPILVNNIRCRLIGHVSMDMLAVDLTAAPTARIGDPVLLWGEGLPVEEIANHAQTIPYELISSVQKRLMFVEHGES